MKQTFSSKPTTKDGEIIKVGASLSEASTAYQNIQPAFYNAIIRGQKSEIFETKSGKIHKLTPAFELDNDNKTRINRQDFVVGFIDDKGQYVSNKKDKFPIWSGFKGAFGLLEKTGVLHNDSDGNPTLDSDRIADLTGAVVSVRTAISGYVKDNPELSELVRNPFEFTKIANAIIKEHTAGTRREWSWSEGDIEVVIREFNAKHNLDSSNGLKTKNHIIGFWSVNAEYVAANDLYVDEHNGVWLTKEHYEASFPSENDNDLDW